MAGEYRLRSREDPQYDRYFGRALAGNTTSVKIELKSLAAVVVRGRVHDQYGLPVSGVRVLMSNFNGSNLMTGDGGEFNQTVMVAKGAVVSKQFRRDGYQRHRAQMDTKALQPGEAVEFDITLQRGSIIVSGAVIDNNQLPVQHASISLYSQSTQVFANGRSNEVGCFTISGVLPADDYRLSVNAAKDYQQYEQQNLAIASDAAALEIELQSHIYGSFSGRVIDSNGAGVAGLELLVKTRGVGGSKAVTTDANGEFTAPAACCGTSANLLSW